MSWPQGVPKPPEVRAALSAGQRRRWSKATPGERRQHTAAARAASGLDDVARARGRATIAEHRRRRRTADDAIAEAEAELAQLELRVAKLRARLRRQQADHAAGADGGEVGDSAGHDLGPIAGTRHGLDRAAER